MLPGSIRLSYLVPREAMPTGVAECDFNVMIEAKPVYSSKKHLVVEKTVPVHCPAGNPR
jgi:hypothetical protein